MTTESNKTKGKNMTDKKMTCWLLRRAGWSREVVAGQLGIDVRTVTRYDKECKEYVGEMPSTQLAIDHLQTMIPKAVEVLREALTGTDLRLASEIASKILVSKGVVKDKKYVELTHDDANATDSELIEEARRIIEGAGVDTFGLDGGEGSQENQ